MARNTYFPRSFALICICTQFLPSQGFCAIPSRKLILSKHEHHRKHLTVPLFMSSIQNDDNNSSKKASDKKLSFQDLMPPLPEDHLILGGDIAALFTYSFLDHLVTSLLISETKLTFTQPDSLLVPVWSDIFSNNFGQSLLSAVTAQQQMADIGNVAATTAALELQNQHYAPILDSFGVSAVLLGTCWLISGYINRAFAFKNTVSCEPNHAVVVAGKTWILMAFMMVGLAFWSDNCFCPETVGGLTKTDTDFIFDSFSVLVTWRYIAASMLGGFL